MHVGILRRLPCIDTRNSFRKICHTVSISGLSIVLIKALNFFAKDDLCYISKNKYTFDDTYLMQNLELKYTNYQLNIKSFLQAYYRIVIVQYIESYCSHNSQIVHQIEVIHLYTSKPNI